MTILTSSDDDFLYSRLIELFEQIKLIQGGSSIPPTLRRHKVIKDYLFEKQKSHLNHIEDTYFTMSDLDHTAIENYHFKSK